MGTFQLSIHACNYMYHVINIKWENHLKLADIVAVIKVEHEQKGALILLVKYDQRLTL